MAKVKKFEWLIDEDENAHGVKAISFVDVPAMESDFIAFSKEKITPKFVKLEKEGEEYKQVVAGLALIPEKEIPRIDPETEEPYVGYFSAETIEEIRNKFHKEEQTQNVNTDHEQSEDVDAYLIESFIISTDKQAEDLVDKGIEEAVVGAWYVAYKVEDEEVFEKVLEGEYNGFSVELYADRILQSFNYNNKSKNKFSMKTFIEKLKSLVNEFETEKVSLVAADIADLGIRIAQEGFDEWTIGEAITQEVVSEDGETSYEAIDDGDYVLEDGLTLVVADGVLAEIKEAEAEEEAPAEEEASKDELAKEVVEKVEDEVVEAAEETEVTEEVAAEEAETVDGAGKKTLEELIDLSKDGYYTVEVFVENGAFSYGSVYANTWKELEFKAENFEAREAEIVTLKEEVEALKLKVKEPIADPKLGTVVVEEKLDYTKMSNFERIARKNNLPVV